MLKRPIIELDHKSNFPTTTHSKNTVSLYERRRKDWERYFSKFVFVRGGTTYLWNKQIIFTDLWVFEIAPSHFCPFQWGDEEGEILTDTKKPGCHFLSDARDKINSPLFQTGRPYQFPKLTRDKSKSNLWTNPNLTRVTNPVGHPGQILRLPPLTNPNACGGQIGFVHRHKSEHSGRDHVRGGLHPD